MLVTGGAVVASDEGLGIDPDDHLHPGASVFSSNKERIFVVDGALPSNVVGRSSNVKEKPGIFRLV